MCLLRAAIGKGMSCQRMPVFIIDGVPVQIGAHETVCSVASRF